MPGKRAPRGQAADEVGAHLLLDGPRPPAGLAQLADGGGEAGRRGGSAVERATAGTPGSAEAREASVAPRARGVDSCGEGAEAAVTQRVRRATHVASVADAPSPSSRAHAALEHRDVDPAGVSPPWAAGHASDPPPSRGLRAPRLLPLELDGPDPDAVGQPRGDAQATVLEAIGCRVARRDDRRREALHVAVRVAGERPQVVRRRDAAARPRPARARRPSRDSSSSVASTGDPPSRSNTSSRRRRGPSRAPSSPPRGRGSRSARAPPHVPPGPSSRSATRTVSPARPSAPGRLPERSRCQPSSDGLRQPREVFLARRPGRPLAVSSGSRRPTASRSAARPVAGRPATTSGTRPRRAARPGPPARRRAPASVSHGTIARGSPGAFVIGGSLMAVHDT